MLAFAEESASGRHHRPTEIDIDNFIRAKRRNLFGHNYADLDPWALLHGHSNMSRWRAESAASISANAIHIGMFCDLPLEQYRYIGNASLPGLTPCWFPKPRPRIYIPWPEHDLSGTERAAGIYGRLFAACSCRIPTAGSSLR